MNKYNYYKSIGICPECGKREARPGKIHCEHCAGIRKAYAAAHRGAHNKSNRDFHARRKEAGLCRKCGKASDYGTYCSDCAYVRNVKRRLIEYRKRKGTWTGKLWDERTRNKIIIGVLDLWGMKL